MKTLNGPGTYVLVSRLRTPRDLVVGRLGRHALPAGYYLYVGSALGGLRARLQRHLRLTKSTHWHIDYLLAVAEPVEIWYSCSAERRECMWAQALAGSPDLSIPLPRMGASDCHCPSHVFFSATRPSARTLARATGHRVGVISPRALAAP